MNATASTGIQHVFALVLENRSFDHMLGFSGITGVDAVNGEQRSIDGLVGTETNSYRGKSYPVTHPADYAMPADPGHEFSDVLMQLAGENALYPKGGPYPQINNSGFVASYVASNSRKQITVNPAEVMKCYQPSQLPVLTALAQEFVVCDRWFSAMPGPTWPNRFFLHGASSGDLDDSPDLGQIAEWEIFHGFALPNGTIFDRLHAASVPWRIYAGDNFPQVRALAGINESDLRPYVKLHCRPRQRFLPGFLHLRGTRLWPRHQRLPLRHLAASARRYQPVRPPRHCPTPCGAPPWRRPATILRPLGQNNPSRKIPAWLGSST
jgi:phospholipase C